MRLVPSLSLVIVLGVLALGPRPGAAQVVEPQGNCGGSYFQDYLKAPDRKAFAYAEDSAGRYACGYGIRVDTGDAARTGALRECRKAAKKAGVSSPCEIFASDDRIVWQGQDIAADSIDPAPRAAAGLGPNIGGYAGAVEPFSTPILLRYREVSSYTGTMGVKAKADRESSSVDVAVLGSVQRHGPNLRHRMSISEFVVDGQSIGGSGALFSVDFTIDEYGRVLDADYDLTGLASELGNEIPPRGSPEYDELAAAFGG